MFYFREKGAFLLVTNCFCLQLLVFAEVVMTMIPLIAIDLQIEPRPKLDQTVSSPEIYRIERNNPFFLTYLGISLL